MHQEAIHAIVYVFKSTPAMSGLGSSICLSSFFFRSERKPKHGQLLLLAYPLRTSILPSYRVNSQVL